ncbi:hypothetical protein CHS0354_020642 [Potamilus streckersoni]|uniref:SLC26A/SulP transporter domain-containing protein n=1 Tax=Potamilus streckersoni TaxID=2493646 RepID=A0AAE0W674_9BIVA|nr:hypothetical protein CHS0354_020642 [Potamilus streckersoni]
MEELVIETTECFPCPVNEDGISMCEKAIQVETTNDGHCKHLISSKWIRTQKSIEDKYPYTCKEESSCSKFMSYLAPCTNTTGKDAVFKFLPFVNVVRKYKFRKYFVGDLLSGISVACLHFPQGMAFGISSSLAPAYGLYTSFFPVILYMIFGTSPHTSFGTNAVIALSTAELVSVETFTGRSIALPNISSETNTTYAPSTDDILLYKASIAAASSFFAGIILFLLGVFRLGIVTTYLSDSFIGGFTTGAAFHIFTSQIQTASGFKYPSLRGLEKLFSHT